MNKMLIDLSQRCSKFLLNISFRQHLIISIILRVILIFYSQIHDAHSTVPYTDIDYKVVTDGARLILSGHSPFDRHTYRYSPLLAYMQLPNILMHPACGKVIYASFDIFVAMLIYALVHNELKSQCQKAVQSFLNKFGKIRSSQSYKESDERNRPEKIARFSACFWLYNPLAIAISTRGNGDSFSSFFVILTIYLFTKSEDTERGRIWYILSAGLSHGFAIHLRLYPLLFSLAYFLCLSKRMTRSVRDFLHQLICPSSEQLVLMFGTLVSLVLVTALFYWLYGWQYIYEAYLYHFVRKDVRHNFSLYFLTQYLSGHLKMTLINKILIIAPQLFLLIFLSFSFGQFRQTLPFCIFSLSFVIVIFNSVVTSQYFIWYIALLPLCINNLQSISFKKSCILFSFWLLGQGFWLLPAYFLEFETSNTFYWIGAKSMLFFLINNFLLVHLIENYSFTSFKVNFKKLF